MGAAVFLNEKTRPRRLLTPFIFQAFCPAKAVATLLLLKTWLSTDCHSNIKIASLATTTREESS